MLQNIPVVLHVASFHNGNISTKTKVVLSNDMEHILTDKSQSVIIFGKELSLHVLCAAFKNTTISRARGTENTQ